MRLNILQAQLFKIRENDMVLKFCSIERQDNRSCSSPRIISGDINGYSNELCRVAKNEYV